MVDVLVCKTWWDQKSLSKLSYLVDTWFQHARLVQWRLFLIKKPRSWLLSPCLHLHATRFLPRLNEFARYGSLTLDELHFHKHLVAQIDGSLRLQYKASSSQYLHKFRHVRLLQM